MEDIGHRRRFRGGADVVRLRTNYRTDNEQACLYRLQVTLAQGQKLFLDYLRRAEWYNAITDNCTTAIRAQRAAADRAPWNWRMLLNGHLDELLYQRGMIVTNLTFAELKKRPTSTRDPRRRAARRISRSKSGTVCPVW